MTLTLIGAMRGAMQLSGGTVLTLVPFDQTNSSSSTYLVTVSKFGTVTRVRKGCEPGMLFFPIPEVGAQRTPILGACHVVTCHWGRLAQREHGKEPQLILSVPLFQ